MRITRRRFAAVGAGAALLIAVAGCTPSGGGAPKAKSDGVLTVWSAEFGVAADVHKAYAEAFAKKHDVKVQIVALTGDELKQKVQAASVSGAFPDIVQYYGGSFMKPLVDANAFLPLDDYVKSSGSWESGMTAGWKENYTFGGKTYAVPVQTAFVQGFANADVLKKAGVEKPPATFDELLAAVKKLKAAGFIPISANGKDGWPMQELYAYLVMRNGGTRAIYDAAAGKLPWDDAVFLKSAEQLQQLVDAGAFQKGYLGEDGNAQFAHYADGKAGMVVTGTWFLNQLLGGDDKTLVDKTIGFAFPTTGGSGQLTEVQGGPNDSFSIAAKSPDADLAWQLIRGWSGADQASKVSVKSLTLVPNTIEHDESTTPKLYNDLVAGMGDISGYTLFWNEILSPEQNTIITSAQNSLLAGKVTPQKMVDDLAAQMKSAK